MKDLIDVFKNIQKHILAGVSYLIPVVVVGGIFTGLGVALGGPTVYENVGTFPEFLFTLGKTGLNLMPAVIGAYVANSIADKSGIGPGFIVGQIAQSTGAGFLGGLIGGVFCGIVVMYLKKIKVHKNLSAFMNIILIPSIATILGAMLMHYVIASIIVAFIAWLTDFVEGFGTANMILLAIMIGVIGSFDLGLFGSKAIGAMALSMFAVIDPKTGLPVMIAQRVGLMCCTASTVPPLVCGLATLIKPKVFREDEREAGKAALFLGCFSITEGAIPLALSDKKVYAGAVIGATVATVCTGLFGVGTIITWGGIPTFPGCTNVPLFILAVAIGSIAGALFIVLTKKESAEQNETEEEINLTQEGEEFNLNF